MKPIGFVFFVFAFFLVAALFVLLFLGLNALKN